MLTCREITEIVTAYAEGQMGRADRLRFRLHIVTCRNCRVYVRQLRATAGALGRLPPPEIPPHVLSELMRRFEGWTLRPR